MGGTSRFILAFAVGVIALGGGSLLWPRFFDAPRPKALQDVRDVVVKTSVGQNAANALGVNDEADVQKIDLGQAATQTISNVRNAVENRVRSVVITNAVNQLSSQFNKLSDEQKTSVRQAICEPQPQQEE